MKKYFKNSARAILEGYGIKAVRIPKPNTQDIIFIAIPKTGSQSVRDSLHRQGMVEYSENSFGHFQGQTRGMVSFGHLDLKALTEAGIVNDVFFSKAFKFAFVRNPYDRVYSAYSYLKRLGARTHATSIQQRVYKYNGFDEFIYNEIEEQSFTDPGLYKVRGNSLLAPQVRWLTDTSGAFITDFVGRFESISEDWEEITSQTGMPSTQLPRLNFSNRSTNYRNVYTTDMVDIVSKAYHEDIQAFKYSFE